MTKARTRVRPALPALGVAHALKTLCALALLGPLGSALAAAAEQPTAPSDPAHALTLVWRALPRWTAGAQWAALLYLVFAPLLKQLVLAALARPGSLRAQLRAAWARLLPAQGLAVQHAGLLAALFYLGYQAATRLPAWVPASPALEDGIRLICLALTLLGARWLGTVHDLASARLALQGSAQLGHGVRAASASACAYHLACAALALALTLAGDVLARGLPWPAAALALQQTLALASALLRAHWLARCIDLMASPKEPAQIN